MRMGMRTNLVFRRGAMLVAQMLLATAARAQFPLRSADGKSGLLGKTEAGLVNYEASESRVGFKTVTSLPTESINDPLTSFIVDLGFSANKGSRDLFKGGSFTPGYDAAFTVAHRIEAGDGY